MSEYNIDWISAYHQGVAIFRSNSLYGVMLTGGNVLINPHYDYLASFNNGYAQAIRGGCCVVIDLSGKEYKAFGDSLVPLESKYDFVRDFKNDLACVKLDGKWGVIDTSGKVLFQPSYDYISDFEYGIAKCIKDVRQGHANHWYILNKEGESLDCGYDEPIIGADGLISLSIGTSTNKRIDCKGNLVLRNGSETVILDAKYTDYNIARDFSCGLSCVQKNDGCWGAIDTKGHIVVPFDYLSIGDFIEDRSFAKDINGAIVLLSENGRIIKRLEGVTGNESFNNGVAIVYKETSDGYSRHLHGSCGLINNKGEIILDFFEGEIIYTDNPTIFTLNSMVSNGSKGKRGKVGYFNSATGLLLKPQYDEIVRFEPDYVVVKALDISECKIDFNGKPFVFNGEERVTLPDWCIGGEDFQNGICKAQGANKKWGLVDKEGATICEPLYDSIGDVNGQYVTTMGSRTVETRDSNSWSGTKKETVVTYGLVNLDDKVTISAKYDRVPEWNGCFYLITIDNLIGVIDIQGRVVTDPKYRSIDKLGKYFIFKQQVARMYYHEDLLGLLDNKGNEIISPKYKDIKQLKDGYFKGKVGDVHEKWYLLNEAGQLSKRSYDEITIDKTGYFRFRLADKEGFLDLEGNIIVRKENGEVITVPSEFAWCSDFKDKYATVLLHNRENFVDEQFSIVLLSNNKPILPDVPIDFVVGKDPEGNVFFQSGHKVGLMSACGKSIIPAEYGSIRYLSKGFYVASQGVYPSNYGIIGIDGAVVLPFEYSAIAPFNGSIQPVERRDHGDFDDDLDYEKEDVKVEEIVNPDFWYISKLDKSKTSWNAPIYFGLISPSGKVLLDAKYEAIQQSTFGFFLKAGGQWKPFDKTFTPIGDGMYDSFDKRDDGYYTVKTRNSKIGVLSPAGHEKLAPIYHSIGDFNNGKFPEGITVISKQGGPGINGFLLGLINKDYDVLLEPQFTSLSEFKNGSCSATKIVNGAPIRGRVDDRGRYTDLSISTDAIPEMEPVSKLENGLTMVKTKDTEPFFSLIDSSGQLLLPFKYSGIELLNNGQYRVLLKPSGYGYGGRYGILNETFEEIIKPNFFQVEDHSSYYIVSIGNQTGVIDTEGKVVVPCKYQSLKKASDHLFWVYEAEASNNNSFKSSQGHGLYGLVDENGKILTTPKYAKVKDFENGYACVMGGGRWVEDEDDRSSSYLYGHWGVVNSAGKEIIPLEYDSIEFEPTTSCFRISKSLSISNKDSAYGTTKVVFGHINTAGERVIKSPDGNLITSNRIYQWQEDYVDGLSLVYHSGLIGQVNEQGQQIIHYKTEGKIKEAILPSQFDWGYDSETDRIVVEKDSKKGLFSILDNRILIEPDYDSISPFGMNSNGEVLYIVTNYSNNDYYRCNERHGLIKETGDILLPPEYSNIETHGFSLIVVTNAERKRYLYDTEFEKLLPVEFTKVLEFGERNESYYWGEEEIIKNSKVAIVCRDGKYGAINNFGEVIIPLEYPTLVLTDGDILVCNDITFDSLGRRVASNGLLTVPIMDCYTSAMLIDNSFIIAQKDGHWGCVNLSMKEIIPFIYESIDAHGQVFIVSRKSQESDSIEFGVVNIQHKIIVPFSIVDEIVFDKGLFIFKKDNLYGAYSDKGILICDALYEKLEGLNSFLIKVGRSDVEYNYGEDWYTERVVYRWGLINFAGEEVLPADYKEIEEKGDSGFIQIKQYEHVGLLDATGRILLEPKYYQIGEFVDSYSIVLGSISVFNKNREVVEAKAYGVIDGALNEVIPCCFKSIEYDNEIGMFKTEKGYKLKDGRFVCSIDKKTVLIPSVYMYCREFFDGRAISIKLNNPGFKYGMIDTTGKDVLPPIFDSLLRFDNGLYRFRLNDLYGIINREGAIILDNQYSGIGKFEDGLSLIAINHKVPNEQEDRKTFGLVNMFGEIILKPDYDLIGRKTNGYNVLLKHGQWSIFNSQNHEETRVNNIVCLGFCHDGRFMINVGGEFVPRRMKRPDGGIWGFVDEHAEIVIAPQYENASTFSEERALVKLNGKWGAIDIEGKIVIPFEYTDVYSKYENGQCRLMSGDTIHVIDRDGKEIETYPRPRSNYDDYDSGYSQEDLDDMYRAAFEGDPSAQWNID